QGPRPTDMVKMTKSKTFQAYLPSCHRTYSCIHCRAHLANHDELISKVRRPSRFFLKGHVKGHVFV
uniref:Yippee domain-containing protein n=1 Tax=Oryzias sinensis TaxID=183150 RepID=A0A8C7WS89_9TELE